MYEKLKGVTCCYILLYSVIWNSKMKKPSIIIIIIIIIITFIQGIYYYVPETNHVSGVYSVAAVLYL
jgi:hypothetical protein